MRTAVVTATIWIGCALLGGTAHAQTYPPAPTVKPQVAAPAERVVTVRGPSPEAPAGALTRTPQPRAVVLAVLTGGTMLLGLTLAGITRDRRRAVLGLPEFLPVFDDSPIPTGPALGTVGHAG
jgi:hypothetical protein